MLLYYLPLALYVVIVPIINEGVELPRSLARVNLMIIYAIFRPQGLKVSQKIDYLPFLMPIFYFFSALTNGQNILSALFGGYNRNFGILTYLALALLYISITNLNNDVVKFFKFCLLPVTLISIAYASIQLYGSDFLNWAEKDRVLLTLGNSNFAASFLGIISPVLIYAFVRNKLRYIKLTYLFLFFVWRVPQLRHLQPAGGARGHLHARAARTVRGREDRAGALDLGAGAVVEELQPRADLCAAAADLGVGLQLAGHESALSAHRAQDRDQGLQRLPSRSRR